MPDVVRVVRTIATHSHGRERGEDPQSADN